jgi:ubiquitin-protein ligase E3 A
VSALVAAASYEDGYEGHEAVIQYLWDGVREDMSDEERRKLLFFTTGSDRVPIKGAHALLSPQQPRARACQRPLRGARSACAASAPWRAGLANLTFIVQRAGPDADRLPTAQTCFSRLLLPEYGSRERLREKLLIAIENSRGFGLI